MKNSDRRRRDEEPKKRRDGPDKPVEERTAELKAANERLQQEIAELRRAEEERVRAVTERAAVVDGMGDGLVLLSMDGRITDVNQAFEKITGYSEGEIVGKDADHLLRRMLAPEDVETASLNLRNTLKGETSLPHTMSFTVETKAGRQVDVTFTVSLMKGEKGEPAAIIALMKDVTERKQAEEKVRKAAEEWEATFNAIPDLVSILDKDHRFVKVNKTYADVFGMKQNDFVGKTCQEVVHGTNEAWPDCPLKQVMETKEPATKEFYEPRLKIHLEVSVAPIFGEKGEITGIVHTAKDITERKRAEEALRESEERLRLVLEGAELGSWDHNLKTGEVIRNHRWAEMLGYTLEEIDSHVDAWKDLVHPDDLPMVNRIANDHKAGRTPLYKCEHRMRTKSGEWKWILNCGKVIRWDEDRKPIRATGTHADITERKQAEESLKQERDFSRSILQTANSMIFCLDADARITVFNDECERITGYSRDEVFGKRWPDLFLPPDKRHASLKSFVNWVRAHPRDSYEGPVVTKSGQIKTILWSNTSIIGSDPMDVTAIAIGYDITERKRAEEALRASEEKYRGIYDESVAAIYVFDAKKNFVDSNQAGLDLLGYSRDELLRMSIPDVDADPVVVLPAHEQLLSGERLVNYEHQLKKKDGTIITVLNNSRPLTDVDGNAVGMQSTLIDITERKRAEEKLRESEKFRNLVEHAHDAICIIQDDHFKFANQEFSDLLNYNWEELKQLDFKEVIAPEHRDMVADRYYRRQKGEKIPEKYEFVLLTKDGERKYMEMSVSLVGYLGEVASHCFLRDVTEKKKMEAQLIQAERLTAVGTLAYGIAHEFNNILAGILGNAEFGVGSGDSKEVERCFRVIMENCDRAGSITNSLLTLARQRQAKKEAADLTDAVENILGLVERELEKQNIRVERKFKPVPEIVCDLGEFSEVFLNMITNARDAMKPDGGTLTIGLRKRNHNIEIIFADTGGGIPDEIKGRIFEPFVTTKGALGQSEIPGTGLGLFLSIGIISRYHGKIEVESKVGKGSKFAIRIPVAENQQLPDRAEAEDERPTVLPLNLNILLVDDEETICNVVKKFLEEKGYSVVDTTSGKKGLKLFKDGTFDLALSDITMPDMDGVKLISELKNMNPDIRIVTLTGHVAEEKLEAARRAGADQILLKPFKKEDLYKAIGRALSV